MVRHLKREVVDRSGEGERPFSGLDRTFEVAETSKRDTQVRQDAAEPPIVTELFGQRLGFAQVRERPLEFPERIERRAELETDVDRALDRLAPARNVAQGLERLLEAGHGLPVPGARHGVSAGLAERRHRLVPGAGLPMVTSQRQRVRITVGGEEGLDRLRDTTVKELAAGWQHRVVRDFTDPVVREVEPLAQAMQDAPAHQLLDPGRSLFFGEPRRPLEQRELELPADHRRHGGEDLARLGQALEPPADDLPNAFR